MVKTTVGVKLEPETRDRLQKLGETKQRSIHWMMREAIARYIEIEERYERERVEDLARYQEFLETGTHITVQEMMTWLDELAEQAEQKASE